MSSAPAGSLVYAAHQQAATRRRDAVHATLEQGLAAPLTAVLGTVIDVAWSKPSPAQVKATGATGLIGYFSHDTTKNLTPAQVSAYVLAGIGVAPVWETTAGRALAGYAAGQQDARDAVVQRDACGFLPSQIIRAAVDTDTTWPSVAAYFEGFASIVGKPQTAPYGGYKITTAAYAAGYRRCWQTLAWSGGRLDTNAALYQNGRSALNGAADVNTILAADWGQYPPLEANMAITAADVKTIVSTDNVLAGPPDAPDHDTNPFWTWASHITGTTNNTRALLKNVAALQAQAASNGSGISALTAKVDALAADVAALASLTLTDAQVAAISAQLGAAVADVLAARLAE